MPSALGQVYACNLTSLSITAAQLGTLRKRGMGITNDSASELFVDEVPLELARWPNRCTSTPRPSPLDAQVTVYGTGVVPDVTGTYTANGAISDVSGH